MDNAIEYSGLVTPRVFKLALECRKMNNSLRNSLQFLQNLIWTESSNETSQELIVWGESKFYEYT